MNGILSFDPISEKRRANIASPSNDKRFAVECRQYVYVKTAKRWDEARKQCKVLGGDLAVITTYKEFDAIAEQLPKHAFVHVGGQLESRNDWKNGWRWISGEPLAYEDARWGGVQPEPDIYTQNKLVVRIADYPRRLGGKGPAFYSVFADNESPFLCQIPAA